MDRRKSGMGRRIRFVLATGSVIFSLATAFTGTYAWFRSSRNFETHSESFTVADPGSNYEIDYINLYKFNYAQYDSGSGLEYLFPEKGAVNKYLRTEEDTFLDVDDNETVADVMNLYDPLQKIISGDSFHISELNTNSIYRVVLSTTTPVASADVSVSSFLRIPRAEREDEGLTYYLSDYVDFDVFTQSEIDSIDGEEWYPEYSNAPQAMAEGDSFSGSGDPTYCEGESVGSVYKDTDNGAFWVKDSFGWEVQESLANTGAPSYAYSAPYYINISNNKVYIYDEEVESNVYGYYREITPTFNNLSTTPGNVGSIDDIYYYHSGSAHQIYKRVSYGWEKRSNVDYETLYYKVAYLASLNNRHAHFYNLEPSEKISLNPKSDLYYFDEEGTDSWVKLEDYASSHGFDYTMGMDEPNHNSGNPDDLYYDYGENALYVKNEDGGWQSKVAATKVSSIADPNKPISFSGADTPWEHDYGEDPVSKGDTYLQTGGIEEATYLFVGSSAGDVTNEKKWKTQPVAYNDGDHDFISGELGDYYVYDAKDLGNNGDLYLDTNNYALYIKDTAWLKQTNVFVGNDAPEEGDYAYYIDTDEGSLYRKNAGNWVLQNPTFVRSSSPQALYLNNGGGTNPWSLITPNIYGNGAPRINTGADNNIYLDTAANGVYVKSDDGGWISRPVGLSQDTDNDYYVDLSPDSETVTFSRGGDDKYRTVVYINVNYAPSQLSGFSDLLQRSEHLESTFRAYLDFGFSFSFSGEVTD
ncbi:MAG: hypothetical protein SPL80_02090 [Bacilli bacterium]|nr:hypothetical protein [Bacilli bacterium]